MKLKFFLIFAVCVFVFPNHVVAATEDKDKAIVMALDLSNSSSMPAEKRQVLVKALLDYWENFDSRIPRITPDEEAWLQEELNSKDNNRLTRAINSSVYALSNLSSTSTSCVGNFETLSNMVGVDKSLELYLWLKATKCFVGYGTDHFLAVAGLSNGRADDEFKMTSFRLVVNAITGKIADSVIAE